MMYWSTPLAGPFFTSFFGVSPNAGRPNPPLWPPIRPANLIAASWVNRSVLGTDVPVLIFGEDVVSSVIEELPVTVPHEYDKTSCRHETATSSKRASNVG